MSNIGWKKFTLISVSLLGLASPTLSMAEPGFGGFGGRPGPGPGRPGPGGPGGPGGGRGGDATQALRLLESASNSLQRGMTRGADRLLDDARRNLYQLRPEFALRNAIRNIDSANDALRDRRRGERDNAYQANRFVRGAIGDVRSSDAYRFEQRGGHGGGGHHRQEFECVAKDSGWEEHRGGHLARGFDEYRVRAQALAECQRFHGRCQVSCQPVR